jgi:hypothetical protein
MNDYPRLSRKTFFACFRRGMREFRSSYTLRYGRPDMRDAYDRGREFMHKITFRMYEP